MTDVKWDAFIIDRFQSQLSRAIAILEDKLREDPNHKIVIAGDEDGNITIGKGKRTAIKQWKTFVSDYSDHITDHEIGSRIQRNIEATLYGFQKAHSTKVTIAPLPVPLDPAARDEGNITYVWGANFGNYKKRFGDEIKGKGQARIMKIAGINEVGVVSTPVGRSFLKLIDQDVVDAFKASQTAHTSADHINQPLAAFYDLSAAENLLRFPPGWVGSFDGDRTKKTFWGPQRGATIRESQFLYEIYHNSGIGRDYEFENPQHHEVYEYILNQFHTSLRMKFTIVQIGEYENRWRWRQYCRQRGEMELEEGRKLDEHCLFYACTTENPAVELEALNDNFEFYFHRTVASADKDAWIDKFSGFESKKLIVVRWTSDGRGHKIVYPAFLVTYRTGTGKKAAPPPRKAAAGGKKPPGKKPAKAAGKKAPPPPPPSKKTAAGGGKPPPGKKAAPPPVLSRNPNYRAKMAAKAAIEQERLAKEKAEAEAAAAAAAAIEQGRLAKEKAEAEAAAAERKAAEEAAAARKAEADAAAARKAAAERKTAEEAAAAQPFVAEALWKWVSSDESVRHDMDSDDSDDAKGGGSDDDGESEEEWTDDDEGESDGSDGEDDDSDSDSNSGRTDL